MTIGMQDLVVRHLELALDVLREDFDVGRIPVLHHLRMVREDLLEDLGSNPKGVGS